MEYSLIKNSITNAIYTFNSGWIDIGKSEPLVKQDYVDYGIQDLANITQDEWDTLSFYDLEVMTWFNDESDHNLNCISKESFKPIYLFDNPKLNIWVDTNEEINVKMNVVAESQTKFLLSKDNRVTWQTFNGTLWETVSLSEIYDKGLCKLDLENLTHEQWSLWFNRHYIDVAIGIKSQNINQSPIVNSITFNFPPNEAPVLSNFEVNPSPINRTNVVLSAKINELEGDLFKYRIYSPTSMDEFRPYALKFGVANSQIVIPHSLDISPTKEMTIDFDIKVDNFANLWMPILYKGTSRQYSIWLNSNGHIYSSIKTTDGVERIMYFDGLESPLELNTFYNISIVVNLNLGYMKMYKNGELWHSYAVPTTMWIQVQDAPLLIGVTPEGNTAYSPFEGIIQNVRLWDKERSIDEINLYKSQMIKIEDINLIGNWHINDNSLTIKDYSVNGNDGLLSGGVWELTEFVYYDENKWSDWSDWINGDLGEYALTHTFSYTDFSVGQNAIVLDIVDDRDKKLTSNVKYIELINNNPIVTLLTHDNWNINGVIDDPNGDKIKYRILINGEQKFPVGVNTFTDFLQVPYNFNFIWDSSDLIIGSYNNEVKIEIMDIYNSITEYSLTDIVGRYKNLMFKVDATANSKFYSDDKGQLMVWDGNLLSYLNLGIMIAGQTSPPEQVYIANLFGQPMENIRIWHEPLNGYDVDFSKDQSFTTYSDEIQFNEVLNDGEQRQFFVRVRTSPLSNGSGGVFEIKTSGDIV